MAIRVHGQERVLSRLHKERAEGIEFSTIKDVKKKA